MTDLERVERKLDILLESTPHRKYYTIRDLSIMHGWSASFINRNPWTMPNFGKSDYPGHERRWLPETMEQWFRVPPADRKRQWNMMSFRQRQALTA